MNHLSHRPAVVRLITRCLAAAALLLGCLAPGIQTVHAAGQLQTLIDLTPAGGVAHIPAGTYTENVIVNKNVTLAGNPGGGTILQPPADAPGITLQAGATTSTIQDMTITGADIDGGGGAISATATTALVITRCNLTNNTGSYGGAIYLNGGSLSVTDSVFQNNHATADGGGLYSGSQLILSNTLFKGNTATRHGGGASVNNFVSMIGGSFEDNTAGENGGGLNLNNDLTISGTSFKNNSAGSDGGGVLQWNAGVSVSLFNATFSDNTSMLTGGGMAAKGNMVVHGGTFLRNTAGVLSSASNAKRGGLYLEAGSLDLTGTTFQDNEVLCTGCLSTDGGGLLVANANPVVNHVRDANFVGNKAWWGAGIMQTKRISDLDYGSLVLERSTFIDNEGGYGGGFAGINVTARDSFFYGNQVINAGGGMYIGGVSLLERLQFSHNTCDGVGGAGLYATGSPTIVNTAFVDNAMPGTSGQGTAIKYKNSSGTMTLQQVTLSNNTGGAGLYIDGGIVNMTNAIIAHHATGVCVKSGSASIEGVLWHGNTNNAGSGTDCPIPPSLLSQYIGDPLFEPDGYHITSASMAVNHGTFLTAVTDDIDGDHRPQASLYDLGADELYFRVRLPMVKK